MYEPKVNDYVRWRNVEGWVYYVDDQSEYLTIEVGVKCKDDVNIEHCPIHSKYHCLIVCYHHDWKDLIYIKSRESIYEV